MIKNDLGFIAEDQRRWSISIRADLSALGLKPLSFLHLPFNTWIHYLLLVLLVPWPFQAIAGGALDTYRSWVGSPLEREIIRYTRACIIHELDPDAPVPELHAELPPTGLYLSLVKGRQVRACIGTFGSQISNMQTAIKKLAEEIVYADLRSQPLSLAEMKDLSVVLSFVGPLREIRNPYGIDFTEEGLYVTQGQRVGVLLPGESKTLDYGLKKIRMQIHINSSEPVRYAAFQVVVFDERTLSYPNDTGFAGPS